MVNDHQLLQPNRPKPLSQREVISGELKLTWCKSTVKAICVGLANSADYPDQWSDATFIWCKLHCERGKLFLSLLGGAACAAVSRDFDFVYISSELGLFLFPDLRHWRAGQIGLTDVLVVSPHDNQLRHLAAIPLRLCLVRQRPDYLLTVKAISDRAVTFFSLVGIKLTRNNHCEFGGHHKTSETTICV